MQLTYRGTSYTVNPQAISTCPTDQEATFLGNRYKLKTPSPMPVQPPTECLRYRGVLYFA